MLTAPRCPGNACVAPLASVVIPAFNEEKAIGRTLDTVMRSVEHVRCKVEVVVVDNASTDGTADVARTYGVRVIQEEKKGVSYARNAGLNDVHTGHVVLSTDADTLEVPREWVARHLDEYEDDTVVAVTGGLRFDRVHALHTVLTRCRAVLRAPLYPFTSETVRALRQFSGANSSLRRKTAIEAGGYDPGVNYGEDQIIARKLARHGRIVRATDDSIRIVTSGRRYQKAVPVLLRALKNMGTHIEEFFSGERTVNDFDDIR